ncbi:hypothetical protein GOBAR_AA36246 [Gossypium barbadense]|uniref:TF-B3 domain-containing protein n=1 Tax=Gossypium barbadense TaxID=3634 RepID=A0A2P5W067_GOSBA|nr:hypothetical protein GOBAR_AA36246 [Gossypium barbadense]
MEIFIITLTSDHISKLRFHYVGPGLRGSLSVLKVKNGYGGACRFKCKSEGGGSFLISDNGWGEFVSSHRIGDAVTLSTEDGEDFYFSVN